MKHSQLILIGAATLLFTVLADKPSFGQGHGRGHRNLAMQDADGDGIPNCQDPDFVRPGGAGPGFTDANGDGINDRRQDDDGDGIPNWKDADSPLYAPDAAPRRGWRFHHSLRERMRAIGAGLRHRFGNTDAGNGG